MNGTIRELHPGSGGLARVLCLVSLAGALGNGGIGIVWVWCYESSQKISRTFLRHGNFSLLESKDLQDKLGRCFLRRTKDLIADQMPKKGKTVFRKVLVVYFYCFTSCIKTDVAWSCLTYKSGLFWLTGFFFLSMITSLVKVRLQLEKASKLTLEKKHISWELRRSLQYFGSKLCSLSQTMCFKSSYFFCVHFR